MKKIKFMLMSLAFLAVVGGALAFKANFGEEFCTADIPSGGPNFCPGIACPNLSFLRLNAQPDDFVCTAEYDGNDCLSRPTCEGAAIVDYD